MRALADPATRALADLLHSRETRPDFLSWRVDDLPCAATHLCRLLGAPAGDGLDGAHRRQRRLAQAHADQMVFEGFSA